VIRFYFHPTPNPAKVALMLEETGLPYQVVPVDTSGESNTHRNSVPSIRTEARVFGSTAILLYLVEKTGRLMGLPTDKPELLSWLLFIATGIGPLSGQAVHFQHAAPEKLGYAINRYRREVERHYEVLDTHLKGREFIVGKDFTIADISAWGWLERAPRVLPSESGALAAFPNIDRWYRSVDARPTVARVRAVGKDHAFKKEMDEETRRALFPSDYAKVAHWDQ
jgi:GST-like protein